MIRALVSWTLLARYSEATLLKERTSPMNNKRSSRGRGRNGKVAVLRERTSPMNGIEDNVRQILEYMGEDPEREGLLKTPYRVARAFAYLTKGYAQDPKEVINGAMFTEDYQGMILVKDIDSRSPAWSRSMRAACRCKSGSLPRLPTRSWKNWTRMGSA